MKKTTIIIITVLYVASIVLVGVFGLKSLSFVEKVYIKEISFLDYVDNDGTVHYMQINGKEIKPKKDGSGYSVILDIDNIKGYGFSIPYKYLPADATITNIEIVDITEGGAKCATLEKSVLGGYLITFNDTGKIDLMLKSTDGGKVTAKLSITAIKYK